MKHKRNVMKHISRKSIFPVLLFIGALIGLQSCLKDNFNFDKLSTEAYWGPSLAIPIAEGRYSVFQYMQEFDSTHLLGLEEDGEVYIQYEKKVYSIYGEDVITLPGQTFGDYFSSAEMDAVGFSGGTCSLTKSLVNNFTVLGDERFDSIVFKGQTKLTIDVQSTFLHTGLLEITFPEMKKNGIPYKVNVNISSNTGNFVYHSIATDLDGYSLDLSNMSTDMNKVLIKYKLTLNDSGTGTITSGNYTAIAVDFSDIEYYGLYGYLGKRAIEVPMDSVRLNMFDREFDGDVYFKDPQLTIYTNNSYGIPISFGFSYFSAYSEIYGDTIDILGTQIPRTGTSEHMLAYPELDQIGQSIKDSIVLTGGSSNIDDVISDRPRYIFFDPDATANPEGTFMKTNFVLDTCHFDVKLKVKLPIWGRARYFRIYDTVKADMHELVDSNEIIENLIFRMIVDNGLPIEVNAQAYFTDSLYNIIDSAVTADYPYLIESGKVDGNGKIDQMTGVTSRMRDFIFPAERIAKLQDTRYVILATRAWTTNQPNGNNIRVYSDYGLYIRLGFRVDAGLSTSDN